MADNNSNTAAKSVRLKLPPGLGCYVAIFEPKPPPPGSAGEPKYQLHILWPKAMLETELVPLRQAIAQVAKTKFGEKAVEQLKSGKLFNPLHDGDVDMSDNPTYAGMVYVNAKSSDKPGIVDRNVQQVFEPEHAYSGCTFRASVSVYAFDTVQKGVSIGLNNLQVVKEGPRLDNRKSAEQDFADFKAEGEAGGAAVDDLV